MSKKYEKKKMIIDKNLKNCSNHDDSSATVIPTHNFLIGKIIHERMWIL